MDLKEEVEDIIDNSPPIVAPPPFEAALDDVDVAAATAKSQTSAPAIRTFVRYPLIFCTLTYLIILFKCAKEIRQYSCKGLRDSEATLLRLWRDHYGR